MLKFILIGIGGVVALVSGIIAIAIFLPEKPSSTEHRGAFEVYGYHHASIGEPGHTREELWYRGKRLAEYPTYTSLNAEQDRVIFVDAKDAPPDAPSPKGNGIYYFDSRTGKKYKLAEGKYPSFLNGERSWPGSGTRISNATPWSPDETFAVVSYGDGTKLPELVFKKESVLLVDLATGEVRNAADLLDVSNEEHVIFLGWSHDHSTMFFRVGDQDRTLPVSAVLKK